MKEELSVTLLDGGKCSAIWESARKVGTTSTGDAAEKNEEHQGRGFLLAGQPLQPPSIFCKQIIPTQLTIVLLVACPHCVQMPDVPQGKQTWTVAMFLVALSRFAQAGLNPA
ncbi:hypothetical protein GOP47_0003195 [Adiantum capillus-veneris]|uniref:Uncharacterized protein n=1 Tax=Adiantum capillus-veneris TaxID=13818 RepID=A0A9D4ZS12_ADICA|nr:hypothetical protein GOP47_0003195 [Adiantum capillus-veneris]